MTNDTFGGDIRLADLVDLAGTKTELGDYPQASAVEQNVLVYDGERLRGELTDPAGRRRVQDEWVRALHDGPGIVVLAGAFGDGPVIDAATREFEAIIAGQRAAGGAAGDHFAAAGQNDRIWNALEKLARRAPEVFAAYYANEALAAVCHAWLGPGYQVTSQVNVVNPGGAAQRPHRDYHLGFQTDAHAAITLAIAAGAAPASRMAHSAGYTASDMLARSTASMARPNADDTWSRLAIRLTSVVWLAPAAWNRAGLKNTASPLASGSWTWLASKYSPNSGRRQAR